MARSPALRGTTKQPPHPPLPLEGGGEGGGDVFNVFFTMFRLIKNEN